MTPPLRTLTRLEEQDRDQLLQTARRLLAEADALSSRISAVSEIGLAVNRTLDIEVILRVIGKQAKWLLDFDYCGVCLQDDDGDGWRVVTLFGPPETPPSDLLATPHVAPALHSGQAQLVRALPADREPGFLSRYHSQIIVPLVADDIVMGSINFGTVAANRYTQDDMRIGYMLALQLSSAIRNARTFAALKRTRDELRERNEELVARNQELDAYNHTIAHDLKSPLNSIILRSEMAKIRLRDDLPPDVAGYLDGIRASGLKMSEMIEQLLWLARLRNHAELAVPVLLRPTVDAALARFALSVQERGITVEVAPEMPAVMGHAQWVEEVFANLISNAIKYMGSANPAPRISIRACSVSNGVRCEVQDSGVGIAPADQARLFAMFTRLHTVEVEGVGLGLSIVHRIITRLKGTVGVESEVGKGSTFWFILPSAPTESPTIPPDVQTE